MVATSGMDVVPAILALVDADGVREVDHLRRPS